MSNLTFIIISDILCYYLYLLFFFILFVVCLVACQAFRLFSGGKVSVCRPPRSTWHRCACLAAYYRQRRFAASRSAALYPCAGGTICVASPCGARASLSRVFHIQPCKHR